MFVNIGIFGVDNGSSKESIRMSISLLSLKHGCCLEAFMGNGKTVLRRVAMLKSPGITNDISWRVDVR